MPEGDKYLSWIEHEGAQHTVFGGETRACFAAIHHQILCDDMQASLGSAIRAFLDAYVPDGAVAAAYLGTEALVEASGAVVEWDASEREPVDVPTPSATNGSAAVHACLVGLTAASRVVTRRQAVPDLRSTPRSQTGSGQIGPANSAERRRGDRLSRSSCPSAGCDSRACS
jgi:hypothetical protein